MSAELRPISLREARRFIATHHRHSGPPQGWLFGVGWYVCDQLVGVGVAGRPLARGLQDGRTVEITRICLSEAGHTASRLYGALCRAAKGLGYVRAVTYTLASESGTSVKAAGFRVVATLEARAEWTPAEGVNRTQRDIFGDERRPAEAKVRWERSLA